MEMLTGEFTTDMEGNITLDLNLILSHCCSNPEYYNPANGESSEWNVYEIGLHCRTFEVYAKPNGDGTYEIRNYKIIDT